jgi:hypothetical protein
MKKLAYFWYVDKKNFHCAASETEKNHIKRQENIALIRSDIRKLNDEKSWSLHPWALRLQRKRLSDMSITILRLRSSD